MRTITIDIINEKVLNLLKDMELLKLIRVHNDSEKRDSVKRDDWKRFKGMLTSQPIEEVDRQLKELREEWE